MNKTDVTPSFSTLRVEEMKREFEVRRQAVLDKITLAEAERKEQWYGYVNREQTDA